MDRKRDLLDLGSPGTWDAVMTVDPGVRLFGWAFWSTIARTRLSKGRMMAQVPNQSGIERAKKGLSWERSIQTLCSKFSGIVNALGAKVVVIEFPELWSGDATSQAAASKGDLFHLAYAVGGLAEVVHNQTGRSPVLVTPKEWKGQLPKPVVEARILEALDNHYRDHEEDAVGMGLTIQGVLL